MKILKLLALVVFLYPIGEDFDYAKFFTQCQAIGVHLAPDGVKYSDVNGAILGTTTYLEVTLYEVEVATMTNRKGKPIRARQVPLSGDLKRFKPILGALVKANNP